MRRKLWIVILPLFFAACGGNNVKYDVEVLKDNEAGKPCVKITNYEGSEVVGYGKRDPNEGERDLTGTYCAVETHRATEKEIWKD